MRALFLASFLLCSTPAWAESLPPAIADQFIQNVPHGQGKYYWGIIHVYDATLWTDAETWSYDKPFALSLRYHISAKPEAISEETVKQLKEVSTLTPEQLERFGKELDHLYPAMKDGDVITAYYTPENKMALYHNGEYRGAVEEAEFVRPFFDIWLSTKTTEPKLRADLLPGQ